MMLRRGEASGEYDAFISYSHSWDKELARTFQTSLQRFACPWWRPRAIRVFRDETNLTAEPHLWGAIEKSLRASRYLVVMASPKAARSLWVQKEIAWWLTNREIETLLIGWTDGTLSWDDGAGAIDWETTDALPGRVMRDTFAGAPRWVDLRWLHDPEQVDSHDGRLANVLAEFAAPIRGVPKDQLVGDHLRHLRLVRKIATSVVAALSILLVFAVTAGVVAWNQRAEAIRQRDVAEARRLAAESSAVREERPDMSLLLAVQAAKTAPVPEARNSLIATLTQSGFAGTMNGHSEPVQQVAVDQAGGLVATASDDGSVILWDVGKTGRRLRLSTIDTPGGPVHYLDFDSTGRLLAAGGMLKPTTIWDVSNPKQPRLTAKIGESTDTLCFGKSGPILYAAGALWDLKVPNSPVLLAEPPDMPPARNVDISADGKTLAVASDPSPTSLWDISDPREPALLALIPKSVADNLAISPDGRRLVTVPRYGFAQIWDISDRARPAAIGVLTGRTGTTIFKVVFSPDGTTLASAQADGTAIWNLSDAARPTQMKMLRGHRDNVFTVDFFPDGQRIVTGGSDNRAILWSLSEHASTPELARIGPFEGAPEVVRFTPDGRTLITSGDRDATTLWDITDRTRPVSLAKIGSDSDANQKISVRSDGAMLARDVDDQPPALWNITDRSRPVRVRSIGDVPGSATFAPDGRTLARYGGKGGVDLFDVSRDGRLRRLGALDIARTEVMIIAEFSQDSRTLAISGNKGATLWDVSDRANPKELSRIPNARDFVAFRPDGRYLATLEPGLVLSLWDLSKPERPRRVSSVAGENGGREAAFTSDGLALVTGSSGSEVTVWNVSDPRAPTKLAGVNGHEGSVYNLVLDRDDKILATGSFDRTARLWNMPSATRILRDPAALACELADPRLSSDEWKRYFGDAQERDIC